MKMILFSVISLCIFSCSNGESGSSNSGASSILASNISWPYEVIGEVDIIDAGVGDSDYASWAIGSVVVDGEDISIDFETDVLESARINLDFNFSSPATLMLGAPKSEHGMLTYPVVEIK